MKIVRKLILFSVIAIPFGLPFMHDGFRELGDIGWYILIGIMLVRPLADVFPDLKILRRLVPLRKEFGILSAVLILAHGYGYFLDEKLSVVNELTSSSYWMFANHLMWGTIGAAVAFILLITSNMIAIRILRKWWKPIQRMAYLFFLLGAIHIALIKPGNIYEVLPWVILVAIFWTLAELKVKVRWNKPPSQNVNS